MRLGEDGYAEYLDAAFLRQLGLGDHMDALAAFWPRRGGPHWDAVATLNRPGQSQAGVLLAEGKSYREEMLGGSGLAAKDPNSVRRIETALGWTQGLLGLSLNTAAWRGPLYQNANRLAHLCWLRSRGIDAWLVHLLFAGDPHGPTTDDEWKQALAEADVTLGLTGLRIAGAGHVFLPAGRRDGLLG